ncbi:hypothetical protein [Helicobacter muridarum]|nr:hypothetical protein [Helicobacter muridarum]
MKKLFLDSKGIESCEFDNGEILNLDSIDLAKYPKLKKISSVGSRKWILH